MNRNLSNAYSGFSSTPLQVNLDKKKMLEVTCNKLNWQTFYPLCALETRRVRRCPYESKMQTLILTELISLLVTFPFRLFIMIKMVITTPIMILKLT